MGLLNGGLNSGVVVISRWVFKFYCIQFILDQLAL